MVLPSGNWEILKQSVLSNNYPPLICGFEHMRIGLYLGRHNGAGGGIGIFTRAYAHTLVEVLEDASKAQTEVVLYGDECVLTAEFLEALELSPVLSAHSDKAIPLPARWYLRSLPNGARYRVLVRKFSGAGQHRFRSLLDQLLMPLYLFFDRVELVHMMSNTALLFSPARQLVTLHDLYQGWPPKNTGASTRASVLSKIFRRYYRLLFSRQAQSAAAIVCDTKEVQREFRERFPHSTCQSRVVELGVDQVFSEFLALDAEQKERSIANWQEVSALPQDFVLVFASRNPRKNLERSLLAYRKLSESGEVLPLVALASSHSERKLVQKLLGPELASEVSFLEWVPRKEFPLLLSAARVVLAPSLAEGFGLPALEAASVGTAVVTPQLDALRRYDSQTNLFYYCDPLSVDSISVELQAAMRRGTGARAILPRTMRDCVEEYCTLYYSPSMKMSAGK